MYFVLKVFSSPEGDADRCDPHRIIAVIRPRQANETRFAVLVQYLQTRVPSQARRDECNLVTRAKRQPTSTLRTIVVYRAAKPNRQDLNPPWPEEEVLFDVDGFPLKMLLADVLPHS